MESIDITSNGLREQGYALKKELSTLVVHSSNGAYPTRFTIYKNDWYKTTRQIEKGLNEKGFDQLIISAILKDMSDNYDKLMANGSAVFGVSSLSHATEAPLEKLNDITLEEWQAQLLAKYNIVQEAIRNSIMPLPQLPIPLEFALSVKNILNIDDNTLPFAGFLLGAPSSLKTVVVELFKKYWHTKYSDDFSPKAFVSHYSGLSREALEKIDLLPKIQHKFFLTPELAPFFTGKEDDIRKAFGNLTRILDGKGLETDSGTQGERGYSGNYMFTWLGAVVDVSSRVHRMMGNLGPKMYFLRLSKTYQKEKDLMQQLKDPRFIQDRDKIEKTLIDYLKWFEASPLMEAKEGGLPKMVWDSSKDDVKAIRQIARLALLIGPMRGVVDVDETDDTQGSGYGYTIPIVEEPSRANQQLYNLARGHALIEGRNHITLADIPLLIKVVLSTAPIARVAIFQMLVANNGTLKTADIMEGLGISKPTVHKAMTELGLLGLVDVKKEGDYDNSPLIITLKDQFRWCLGSRFRQLRQGYSSPRKARKQPQTDKRSSKRGDNVEVDSTKRKELSGLVIHDNSSSSTTTTIPPQFWTVYDKLENQETHTVSESLFKQNLVSSGMFTASEATQAIKEAIDSGRLTRLGYDVLANNSQQDTTSCD